ncbi:MAG: TRAP transporter large permease subunit, partial [Hyphomicrobiales bacterium]|nr:TRAP transporter large permease subunit [Hyphomicrobiales bacterium]
AFTLAGTGLIFAAVGIALHLFRADFLHALPERVLGVMSSEILLAIPFFVFMGMILERSGLAEDLLETMGQLFGPVRGGLGYSVIFVGALLAAMTGVVAASVISMGLISLPIMLRHGYDRRLAAGVIAASGTLAQVIPPGIVLIVLADQLNVSVIDIFAAALRPALMLAALYALYVFAISKLRPDTAPSVPSKLRGAALARRVALVMLPPLALIFLVLGSIFFGVATPSEGGAMGASGALLLALMKGRLNLDLLREATHRTARLASFAIFILVGSRVFSLTFFGVNGHKWVESLLVTLPGGATGFLLFINALIFVLAFFLEFFEIAFILVPLIASAAVKLGIDLVWLAVLIGVNVQTSFMHPPFGYSLFYLRSVAPDEPYRDRVTAKLIAPLSTKDIYWGAVPFVALQVVMVVAIIALPGVIAREPQAVRPPPQGQSQQERIEELEKAFGPAGLPERR